MGSQKKKAIKFIAKGNLSKKLKQRNEKRKFQALKDKRKKNRAEAAEERGHGQKKNVPAENDGNGQARHKKGESDMLDDMDVDDFLNADFMDSDAESDLGDDHNEQRVAEDAERDADDVDDGESSEEEDESALDPRYMTGLPTQFSFGEAGSDDDEEEEDAERGDDNDDEDDDEEETGADVPKDKDDVSIGRKTLSMDELVAVEKSAFTSYSLGGLRKMMKIFSDACRSSDAADTNRTDEIMYDIESSVVYNRLMLSVFRKAHVAFGKLVLLESASNDKDDNEQDEDAAKSISKIDERKWKKHALLLRRFFSCACYLLEQTTGQDIQVFVLRELAHYIQFLLPCQKTARRLLKALLKLWAKSLNTNVCMLSFVRIRDLALKMPFPFLELCLKGIYLTYMRNTKFTNETTLPHHILMGNCVVELYGLDLASSYQHAFIYVRQLAIAIRKTITSPSAESFKAVLNWQFFNQLRVWTAVVCAYPEENQLHALVYPLCQLLFAVVRLASTIRYAPMRFQCVKLLQQIAFATNSFVPTSPVLLEILQMPPFSTSYKGQKGKAGADNTRLDIDLELCVKLSKSALDNKRVHDLLMTRLFELLQRECDVYKFSIGFPELSVPLILTLSKYASTVKIPRWKSLSKGLVENLKKRADVVRSKRAGLDVSPKDIAQLDAFLKSERDAAVNKLFASDAAELKKRLDAQQDAAEGNNAAAKKKAAVAEEESDDEDDDVAMEDAADEDADNEDGEETKTTKSKKKSRRAKKRSKMFATTVDDETYAKVKKMSLKEFKKSVAAVDAADEVGDFQFSDDE
ncbi:TPA: hypothetical protein N0F65_008433 [Lagenidium giganteum]|uniref:Nucleolar complex protein 2 n=1 Tax=Lagenidium giganteum TaxID=4803 RepID=A0AAV2YSG0_9STRA|nr:TPA: hypothetical protein N0F65_008433 [Lagenidium giganteum]